MAVNKVVICVCVFLAFLSACDAYGTGAPQEACVTMHPGHMLNATTAVVPQTSASPYSIVVGSKYTPGSNFSVQIVGPVFRGFLLQARRPGSTTPVGTFSNPPNNTKTTQCTTADSSMTHANTNEKQDITLTWNAPSTGVGNVQFVATVAEMKVTYWMDITSVEVAQGVASFAKPSFYVIMALCLLQAALYEFLK
uniref:Stromal cell derived factor 2-like protein n=1 Tax=Branchiostoma belcheri tsingtauense TaxID=155462 RepID=Q6J206_BRABE|nr:stromal cell derived factor 2-like protein [Branchiostoma belcheri tsingtauense]